MLSRDSRREQHDRRPGFLGPATITAFARRIGAIAAALLPVRYWSSLDAWMPVTSSAIPSAILTFLAGAAVGVRGFLEHASALASVHNELMLEAATTAQGGGVTTALPVAMNSLAMFTFLFTTPAGWASMYLCLSGFVRGLSVVTLEPRGDPILSLLDWTAAQTSRTWRMRRAAAERLALEGPEVPDRVVPGARVGLPAAHLVIVASRRRPDWDAGTVVLTQHGAYRIGSIEERQLHGRLRTLYPLTEHMDLEVFRRTVQYELPPEGGSHEREE